MSRYLGPVKWLGGIALVMFILAYVFGTWVPGIVAEETRNSVLFHAIPFFFAFVGVLLLYILLIVLAARRFNGKIPGRTYKAMEYLIIGGIVFGTVCLFNPWSFIPYRYGFLVLLFSTLGFILWSHIVGPRADYDDSIAPLTRSQHLIGAVAAVVLMVALNAAAIGSNAPSEPYGIRQRVWNTYDDARKAQIADEAIRSFNQVEMPFLILFNLFPGAAVYLIGRELVGGERRRQPVIRPAAAVGD
ncbi:MAG: hypothetical protein JNM70_09715 [Anaerolineae bacterium]|nr:hypothetical protein [Anaerolineae bacterium]